METFEEDVPVSENGHAEVQVHSWGSEAGSDNSIETNGPDLDPESQLNVFYKQLVTLNIVGSAKDAKSEKSEEPQTQWHEFLDSLSWLADYKPGGKTVSSVGAQRTEHGSKFWLAANSNPELKARKHIEWVLHELEILRDAPPSELENIGNRILERSISFSVEKVKNYRRQLFWSINRARSSLSNTPSQSGERLLQILESLEMVQQDHYKLCSAAYHHRKLDSLKKLSEKGENGTKMSVWVPVRHYIGRLSSWAKAVKTLVVLARKRPHLVQNFSVACVQPPTPTVVPLREILVDLENELAQFPSLKGTASGHSRSRQLDNSTERGLVPEYIMRYATSDFRPVAHAEALNCDHFYANDFEFVDDDRYIGCSKPSCYCCDLYIKNHPGRFLPRPYHGNLWIKWCAPTMVMVGPSSVQTNPAGILKKMINHMGLELQIRKTSSEPKGYQTQDSATGISSSLGSMGLS